MTEPPTLSVVVPMLNEEANVAALYERVCASLAGERFEIVLVASLAYIAAGTRYRTPFEPLIVVLAVAALPLERLRGCGSSPRASRSPSSAVTSAGCGAPGSSGPTASRRRHVGLFRRYIVDGLPSLARLMWTSARHRVRRARGGAAT